ncbi:MAG: hypothetical protein ACREUE_06560 [Panacagrimonas sp.]
MTLLLAACAPRLYERQTVALDHPDLESFEIRYADFDGCLLRQTVPVSYLVKRSQYVLALGVHFGNTPQPPALDVDLLGDPDLTASFPGRPDASAPMPIENGARYRLDADRLGTMLAVRVQRDGRVLGEERFEIERSHCRALSLGE